MLSRNQVLNQGLQESAWYFVLLWLSWYPSCKTNYSELFPFRSPSGRSLFLSCTACNWGRYDTDAGFATTAGVSLILSFAWSVLLLRASDIFFLSLSIEFFSSRISGWFLFIISIYFLNFSDRLLNSFLHFLEVHWTSSEQLFWILCLKGHISPSLQGWSLVTYLVCLVRSCFPGCSQCLWKFINVWALKS